MIYNENFQKAISNLGWVDKGDLRIHDAATNTVLAVKFPGSKYLDIHNGINDYFSILHQYDGYAKIDITVHHFSDPSKELDRITLDNNQDYLAGNRREDTAWQFVPRYYVTYFAVNGKIDCHCIHISLGAIKLCDEKIEWYKKGSFDFDYQGLIGVTEISNELIFSVQRHSILYRFSIPENKITNEIQLAERNGNPIPKLVNNEIWVADYDTIVKFSLPDWKLLKKWQVQPSSIDSRLLIGDINFELNQSLCIVPRPYSGDILFLDKEMNTIFTCTLGKQPLEATLFKDGMLVVRDWKTGNFFEMKLDNSKNLNAPSLNSASSLFRTFAAWFMNCRWWKRK